MSNEGKDTALFEARREEKANDVNVQFIKSDEFNILDDEGQIKYFVKLDLDSRQTHECTCRSFQHGNTQPYLDLHGINFECKHIKAGYNKRTESWN